MNALDPAITYCINPDCHHPNPEQLEECEVCGTRLFINHRYRTNPNDETLIGYSLGGIFALHVLFNHTDAFDRFVIGSPAIRWDDHMLFDAEASYAAKHDDLNKAVHISAGGLESPLRVANVHTMYARLTAHDYPNLNIAVDIFDNETHMTGINATVMQGLYSVMAHELVGSTD